LGDGTFGRVLEVRDAEQAKARGIERTKAYAAKVVRARKTHTSDALGEYRVLKRLYPLVKCLDLEAVMFFSCRYGSLWELLLGNKLRGMFLRDIQAIARDGFLSPAS
ncbi:unnamed protein product, partial [Amoebophrya sp. A120]